MRKLELFVLLIMVALTACEKSSTNATDDTVYFPLDVGNSWTFHGRGAAHQADYRIFERQVFLGREWYRWGVQEQNSDWLRWARQKVYRIRNDEQVVWLDCSLQNGDSYDYPASDKFVYTVTVNRGVDVTTDSLMFDNCIRFDFDNPDAVDDEISYTLAPEVGIVEITGVWVYQQLVNYELSE